MARRATPRKRGPGRPEGSGVKGHVLLMVSLRPDQREALVTRAEQRRKRGERPPISEVVREALDKALGTKPPAARREK